MFGAIRQSWWTSFVMGNACLSQRVCAMRCSDFDTRIRKGFCGRMVSVHAHCVYVLGANSGRATLQLSAFTKAIQLRKVSRYGRWVSSIRKLRTYWVGSVLMLMGSATDVLSLWKMQHGRLLSAGTRRSARWTRFTSSSCRALIMWKIGQSSSGYLNVPGLVDSGKSFATASTSHASRI
jgi:hypothetical protein